MMHDETIFAADGAEIRRTVIGSAPVASIRAEVSVDHEI
jgi:hypothetical protein